MALNGFQRMYDKSLAFSTAQVLDNTADTASTNEIDLGAVGMGVGAAIKGIINVTALSGTLVVKVCGKATTGPAKTDLIMTLPTTSADATGQYHFTLPQNCPQFIKLYYTAGTSGTVSAYLTADVQ